MHDTDTDRTTHALPPRSNSVSDEAAESQDRSVDEILLFGSKNFCKEVNAARFGSVER